MPGVAVLVWEHDQVKYFNSQGKRSLQKEEKVESLDKWYLGSDTKAMTAFLIALAVQKGQLSYDSKLTDIVGKKVPFHPLNSDLTLSDLRNHSISTVIDVGISRTQAALVERSYVRSA